MLRTGRGAGVARPYKWHIYGHTAWVSKTTLFRGRMPPQTFDVHRSDLRDAIYAKIEKSIYRGAGIARLYITTYIRAPGMGKQDLPLPGVVCPPNFGSPSIRPQGRYICKNRKVDLPWCRHSQTIYNDIYTGTRHG